LPIIFNNKLQYKYNFLPPTHLNFIAPGRTWLHVDRKGGEGVLDGMEMGCYALTPGTTFGRLNGWAGIGSFPSRLYLVLLITITVVVKTQTSKGLSQIPLSPTHP